MANVRISDLPVVKSFEQDDRILVMTDINTAPKTQAITIGQLLALQSEALNRPCNYCGSRGKYDRRGNCGACGAPVGKEQNK